MNLDTKIKLITQNLDEVIGKDEIKELLKSGQQLKHYIGFEISGKLHIGSGYMTAFKIRDLQKAGISTTIFLADWHTIINDKLGGNKTTIRDIGIPYFKEAFTAVLKAVGADANKVRFVTGSELYHHNDRFWESLVDIAKNVNLARIKRSIDILGRSEGESVDFAKLIYPVMQVSDIFELEANFAHAGMDQRKAHVIARDTALKLKVNPMVVAGKKVKPIALHHHLILGLTPPSKWPLDPKVSLRDIWASLKMSKSKPGSAVFVTDTPEEIEQKIKKAFCPEGEINFNPILDWTKHLLFAQDKKYTLKIERKKEYGGDVEYTSFKALEEDFALKKLHPVDLKNAVSKEVIRLLEPVREHFSKGEPKKLKEAMDNLKITR